MELEGYVAEFKKHVGEKTDIDTFNRALSHISGMMISEFLNIITTCRPENLDGLFLIQQKINVKYDSFIKEVSPIMERSGVTFKEKITFEIMIATFAPELHKQLLLGYAERLKELKEKRRLGKARF